LEGGARYGTMRLAAISFKNRADGAREGNAYAIAFDNSGFGTTRRVASVMMPNVPSAPKKRGVRFARWPSASESDAVLSKLPSGRITRSRAIASRRLQPRGAPKPVLQELIAPPTVLQIEFMGTI